ncbi:nitrate regulatory protein [Delftia sp. PS-11]|uniref:nitrate regulatory protein n=1 Tax=Delftia sp. PS-11 TaxID=2767222 RepID=UPI002457B8FE|nr:nitrate regulatory protein [Delftia sp. PS-11]KAJ8743564.1 nitrate- and nitrite sensing domain-containing protein [Delftia sp. PS-11]
MKSALHFLVAARQCEIAELEQLQRTSALVERLSQFIHALQKERGLSNVFLYNAGGHGDARHGDARQAQMAECDAIAEAVRESFFGMDTTAGHWGHGARLFSRIAYVLQELDALPALRARIDARDLSPEAATAAFIQLVAGLLAVVFEAADSAPDPGISRLLVAMFNFMQGKEFAGQERATGVAAFGAGISDAQRQQHWLHLIASQERCLQVFAEFSPPLPLALWREACAADATVAVIERLRRVGCTAAPGMPLDGDMAMPWFDSYTLRMDAMQAIEALLATELQQQCARRITEARAALQALQAEPSQAAMPQASGFLADGDGQAHSARLGPQLDRSVIELVQDQSQRLLAMQAELETVRAALGERKTVERAKGLLMARRQLGEGEAHKLLRQTAMNQNRRLIDVAEAVLAMADLLPPAG